MRWNLKRIGALLVAVVLAGGDASLKPAAAAEPSVDAKLGGTVIGCEHFAFVRAKVAEGLGGPAREACKSWHVSICVNAQGTAYALDAENCQVYRIKDGTVRVLAGDGIRGYRDGPADRARFDFGVGSYQDADINLKSTSIDWLTISSVNAHFQGTATINGEGVYTFRVKVTDNGEPGAGADFFDIKIWEGTDTEAEPYHKAKNIIDGGNIKVHKK